MNARATNAGDVHDAHPFDTSAWLAALEQIGGGYALDTAGKSSLLTRDCKNPNFARALPTLVYRRGRMEAIGANRLTATRM